MLIKINENRKTDLENIKAGYIKENLAFILEFEFPEYLDKYNKIIEFEYNGEKSYDILLENKYELKANITQYSLVTCQIVFTQTIKDNEVQIYKTNKFYISFDNSINAEDLIEDLDQSKIDMLNTLIGEVNVSLDEVKNNKETLENYSSYYAEYKQAYETRKKIIDNLYQEIKIIKKLKV